jgi:Rieske Fe-S protein
MDRRRFVKLCSGSAAMLAARLGSVQAGDFADFPRVRLVDEKGAPFLASSLAVGEAYLFHYPYRSTPCFLINLGQPAAGAQQLTAEWGSYSWPGGTGKQNSLVSYVAICSHQLSFPDKEGSAIRYAAEGSEIAGKPGMIVCCAHASVFDPSAGAKRVHGEATEPLAAIRLGYDAASDSLVASGVAGVQLIERFFSVHKRRLIEDYGPGVYREPVGDSSTVIPFAKYTASPSRC